MNTIGGVIKHVSTQLNDQRPNKQYVRWSRDLLLEYMNQALKEIAAYRPEAFAQTATIPLVPGSVQTLPEGATLQGVTTAHETDDKLMKAFGAYAHCPPTPLYADGEVQYVVHSYAIDSSNPHIFYVSPPVPAGVEASITVSANGAAFEYTLADWNKPVGLQDKFYNNMIDYMMARAYQLDSESQVSLAQSQRLMQLFYQAMGQKYKIDSARGSGYYLGEVGTGDSRSAQ